MAGSRDYPPHVDDLKAHVRAAAKRPEVCAAIADLYADLRKQVDQRRPICSVSGRCCHFDQFGHRLYVTTMELAAFVGALAAVRDPGLPASPKTAADACPFKIGRLCSVHSIRPFGCRIFFCDSTAQQWQQEQYELFHADIKRLHESLDVPYFYVEWRQGLSAILPAITSAPATRPD